MQKLMTLCLSLVFGLAVYGCAPMQQKPGSMQGKPAAKSSAKKKSGSQAQAPREALMVADFDAGVAPNNLGGAYGAWDKDPNDDTQSCKEAYSAPGRDGIGQCLKITYDVDSPNPAYNGFWMKLEGLDLRSYSKLIFWVKGDSKAGFTSRFKVELKNAKEVSPYYISNIGDDWQMIEIPLAAFAKVTDWSKTQELVIVLEDNQVTEKTGVIYVDDIQFAK